MKWLLLYNQLLNQQSNFNQFKQNSQEMYTSEDKALKNDYQLEYDAELKEMLGVGDLGPLPVEDIAA